MEQVQSLIKIQPEHNIILPNNPISHKNSFKAIILIQLSNRTFSKTKSIYFNNLTKQQQNNIKSRYLTQWYFKSHINKIVKQTLGNLLAKQHISRESFLYRIKKIATEQKQKSLKEELIKNRVKILQQKKQKIREIREKNIQKVNCSNIINQVKINQKDQPEQEIDENDQQNNLLSQQKLSLKHNQHISQDNKQVAESLENIRDINEKKLIVKQKLPQNKLKISQRIKQLEKTEINSGIHNIDSTNQSLKNELFKNINSNQTLISRLKKQMLDQFKKVNEIIKKVDTMNKFKI